MPDYLKTLRANMRWWALAWRSSRFADLKTDALRIAKDYRDIIRQEERRAATN